MKRGAGPLLLALAAALFACSLLAVRSWQIDYAYSIDFQAYWLGGQRLASGHVSDLYAAGGGEAAGTPRRMVAGEFKNIPLVAAAFIPLSHLPYLTAKRVFWWINLTAVAATALVLALGILPAHWGTGWQRFLLALAALAVMAPTHIALRHAQTTPLITLLFSGALALALRGKDAAAGLLLAGALLVKWPSWSLAAVDLIRGRSRALLAWSAGLTGGLALSLILFGPALHITYIQGILENAGTVMTGHNNQSVAAVVTRLTGDAPVYDWTPHPLTPAARGLSTVLSLALLLAVATGLWRSRQHASTRRSRQLEFAAASAVGLVVLPLAWDHYFMLLIPGLLALTVVLQDEGHLRRRLPILLLVATFAALALPTPTFVLEQAATLGLAGALLLSHYFAGALGMLALALMALWRPPAADAVAEQRG